MEEKGKFKHLPSSLYDQRIVAVALGIEVDNVVAALERRNRMRNVKSGKFFLFVY
jgi:hypothetical protein